MVQLQFLNTLPIWGLPTHHDIYSRKSHYLLGKLPIIYGRRLYSKSINFSTGSLYMKT